MSVIALRQIVLLNVCYVTNSGHFMSERRQSTCICYVCSKFSNQTLMSYGNQTPLGRRLLFAFKGGDLNGIHNTVQESKDCRDNLSSN